VLHNGFRVNEASFTLSVEEPRGNKKYSSIGASTRVEKTTNNQYTENTSHIPICRGAPSHIPTGSIYHRGDAVPYQPFFLPSRKHFFVWDSTNDPHLHTITMVYSGWLWVLPHVDRQYWFPYYLIIVNNHSTSTCRYVSGEENSAVPTVFFTPQKTLFCMGFHK
jgi:hypothetical protein